MRRNVAIVLVCLVLAVGVLAVSEAEYRSEFDSFRAK